MNAWLHSLFQQIIDFAGAHPSLVGLLLFIFSCSEGLAIIGATLPGETVVLGIAAIGAAAGADVRGMLAWASAGAIFGDGLSFWVGRRYGEAIVKWPGLRSRPGLLERGEDYIRDHGAKSIAIARFIPVIRSIVPLAAGVLKMEPKRFYFANVTSGVFWAAVHIFPAAAMGMAYRSLGEVSGRIAAVAVILLVLIVALIWLVRLVVMKLVPRIARLYARAVAALSRREDRFSAMAARLLDPTRPGFAAVTVWSAVLILAITGLIGMLENVFSGDPLVRADVAVHHFAQGLRSEPADAFMTFLTSLGDAAPLTAAAVTLVGLLLFQRAWKLALAAGGTISAAVIAVPLIKFLLHKPRPVELFTGANAYGFPSGHVTLSAVIFGILSVLVARGLGARGKTAVFSAAVLWVGLIGVSRIYLGAHWLSDVLGGMLFGVALTAIFELLLAHARPRPYSHALLAGGVLAVFALTGVYHAATSHRDALALYAPQPALREMALEEWTNEGWRRLPARRIDLGGGRKNPLPFQWAGAPEDIAALLRRAGWRRARETSWREGLKFFSPAARLYSMAPLPILHDGRLPALTLTRPAGAGAGADRERLVFRFWESGYLITQGEKKTPLLLGAVSRELLEWPVSWFALMREKPPGEQAMRAILTRLREGGGITILRKGPRGPFLLRTPERPRP